MSGPLFPGALPRANIDDLSIKRAQAFIDLCKSQMEQFRSTQGFEWKANIGYWTLLAGAIYAVLQHPIHFPFCLVTAGFILTVVMHLCWLVKIQHSEQYDKRLWIMYRTKALRLLRHDNTTSKNKFKKRWWHYACWLIPEVWPTVVLSLFLSWLLTRQGATQPQICCSPWW